MYENHPVRTALEVRLQALREQYRHQPTERNRYQLVRQEQLLAQWATTPFAVG